MIPIPETVVGNTSGYFYLTYKALFVTIPASIQGRNDIQVGLMVANGAIGFILSKVIFVIKHLRFRGGKYYHRKEEDKYDGYGTSHSFPSLEPIPEAHATPIVIIPNNALDSLVFGPKGQITAEVLDPFQPEPFGSSVANIVV